MAVTFDRPSPNTLVAHRITPGWVEHAHARLVVEPGRRHDREEFRHVLGRITVFFVSGLVLPLAIVAPIMPRSFALTPPPSTHAPPTA